MEFLTMGHHIKPYKTSIIDGKFPSIYIYYIYCSGFEPSPFGLIYNSVPGTLWLTNRESVSENHHVKSPEGKSSLKKAILNPD